MPPVSAEAPSPASSKGDAPESGNLSSDQAAAQLFATSQRPAKAPTPPAEETAPEAPEAAETTESAAVEPEAEIVETSTEETETAPEEVAAEETPAEEDEALSQKTSDERAKAKADIAKRIGKEVAKTKEAIRREEAEKARADAAERRIQELETAQTTAPAAPVSDLPPDVAKLNDLASIQAYRQQAIGAKRFAEENLEKLDDGEPIPDGYDRKSLRDIKRNAQLALEDHIPQREGFVKLRIQSTQQAHKEFPFLTDKTSPDYALVQEARKTPWLQGQPNAEYIIGLQVLGFKAHQAQKAEAAKPAEKPKPKIIPAKPSSDQTAVSSTGTSARVLPATANRQSMAAEEKKLSDMGGVSADQAARFLERKEKLRTSR